MHYKKQWHFESPARLRQITKCIPDLWGFKSVLYIGANLNRMQFVPVFVGHKFMIDVVEIHEPNIKELKQFNDRTRDSQHGVAFFRNIIHADVRDVWKLDELLSYDVVFWWHGPEHLPRDDFEKTMAMLERFARKIIVAGCPWGIYHQPAVRNNPHERHLSHLTPLDFNRIGYATNTIGRKNVRGSNILSWKRF